MGRGSLIAAGVALAICAKLWPQVALAGAGATQPTTSVSLTPAQLFEFADHARDIGDFTTAEQAYRTLATNPDVELRSEARFRLAMMLADRQQKYRDAAIELRHILDEKPKAARIRLELARMDAMLGNLSAAEREFRAAQAAELPPEVEQMVRFYARALSARKPFGGSIEIGLAPDSNINRATRSDTLGTVIGDFTLDQNAKARSGLGLTLRGQAYLRAPLGTHSSLLARGSASGDFYRQSAFDDLVTGVQIGPEFASGRDRISLSAGPAWRWYGTDPYSATIAASGNLQHPLDSRTQLRLDGSIAQIVNRRNALQSGMSYAAAAGIDRAFSARFGGGFQLGAAREHTRDPGYATASGGASVYGFRELGKTTAVITLGYNHLEADARLFLYPRRRSEDRISASLSGTFRAIRIGSFSPYAKVKFEENRSTIEIYTYRRVAAEFGLTSAF